MAIKDWKYIKKINMYQNKKNLLKFISLNRIPTNYSKSGGWKVIIEDGDKYRNRFFLGDNKALINAINYIKRYRKTH